MRRRLIAIGLVLLVVGLAAAYWFTQVPGQIAEDHRDRALPEHVKVAQAVDGVAETLTRETFSGGDYTAVNRARGSRRYLRAYRRVSSDRLRRLKRPARAIADARDELREVDRQRLFKVESRPLLDGSGPVEAARAIARREPAFLGRAKAVLTDYERAVGYAADLRRVDDRAAEMVARGLAEIPNRTVTNPKQLTVPLDRFARRLRPVRRAYLRLGPPRELRREPKLAARAIAAIIQETRRASAAFARFDNAGAQAAQRRLTRRLRENNRRNKGALARFVDGSSIRRQFDALHTEDSAIRRAYKGL